MSNASADRNVVTRVGKAGDALLVLEGVTFSGQRGPEIFFCPKVQRNAGAQDLLVGLSRKSRRPSLNRSDDTLFE